MLITGIAKAEDKTITLKLVSNVNEKKLVKTITSEVEKTKAYQTKVCKNKRKQS